MAPVARRHEPAQRLQPALRAADGRFAPLTSPRTPPRTRRRRCGSADSGTRSPRPTQSRERPHAAQSDLPRLGAERGPGQPVRPSPAAPSVPRLRPATCTAPLLFRSLPPSFPRTAPVVPRFSEPNPLRSPPRRPLGPRRSPASSPLAARPRLIELRGRIGTL